MDKVSGLISSIQRMSLHDGPGIRTTVFMKGCNLRCLWCHNPETFSSKPELEYIPSKCINCHHCIKECKNGCLTLDKKTDRINFDKQKCISCFKCCNVCYPQALSPLGIFRTPDELIEEIKIDLIYFKNSGGGVTFSGGEPMLQHEFICRALKQLKQNGIHTILETNLTVPWRHYEYVMPYVDLIIGDIKIIDEQCHIDWTKGSNKEVLKNIKSLDRSGAQYWLRTPVVPDFNFNEQAISALAVFVSDLKNLQRYELLPFHNLGNYKYDNLQTEMTALNKRNLNIDDLKGFQRLFDNCNFQFSIGK